MWGESAEEAYRRTIEVINRAAEFVKVVKGLWDSWADNAVLDDRTSGRYADPQRVRPINHEGKYYKVKGGRLDFPPGETSCTFGRPFVEWRREKCFNPDPVLFTV